MCKVSIIVPVYNTEKYLKRCIDSIISQTYHDWELILIDDGSVDKSGEICDEYASFDSRIQVIHQKNKGVSHARNVGINVARGTYIMFCDSDDYVSNNWVEDLYTAVREHSASMVYCNYIKVSEIGDISQKSNLKIENVNIDSDRNKFIYYINRILNSITGWEIWNRLFIREIISENRIRFSEECENFAEDLCFVLEYLLYCKTIIGIEAANYYYVEHPNSMMGNSKNKIKLNALNEVSYQFGHRFNKEITTIVIRRKFPILHFLIMFNQYRKAIYDNRIKVLGNEVKSINHDKWNKLNTKRIFWHYPTLVKLFGEKKAQKIILLSLYITHGNWKRFTYESGIYYRFLTKHES